MTRHMLFSVAALIACLNTLATAEPPAWPPKFYAFCVEVPPSPKPLPLPAQAAVLRELGFDGAGHPLWLDDKLETNLQALDGAGLQLYMLYTSIDLKAAKPYDARVPEAMRKLKGRPVTLCVLLRGFKAGDPQGMEPAVKALRELGDLAAQAGLRISIYHHMNDWTESLPFALQVVEKANHAQVGVNFNLCHWLKLEGDKDYAPLLRAHAAKIFAVTINGTQLGQTPKRWTDALIQPLDRGDFDNRRLLATLREIGYRGPVGLMCFGLRGDPRDYLQRSMKVWRSWHTAAK